MAVKESFSYTVFSVFNYTFFVVICFIFVYPFWYVLIQSLSSGNAVDAAWLPKNITFENYTKVFKMGTIGHAVFVSVSRTVIGTVFSVFVCMLLGYLFSKDEMPCKKILYRILIVTMYISAGIIPTYLVYKFYGLTNNFWVYVLPNVVSAYNVILIKTYVEQLPASIEESAKIDGAGTMTIFMKIILPMCLPILATIIIFTAVGQWNSWFDNHLYAFQNKNLMTMQYMLYRYLNEAERIMKEIKDSTINVEASALLTPRNIRMTITMVTVIPIIFVYPFLQRYFVKGIVIGAVKG
jgi:multiple sugar transport system permease protein/putative aldouronate transport system permease protein